MEIYLKIKLEEIIFKCFYHKETMFEAAQLRVCIAPVVNVC